MNAAIDIAIALATWLTGVGAMRALRWHGLFYGMSCEECRGKGYRLVVDGRPTKPSRPQRRRAHTPRTG